MRRPALLDFRAGLGARCASAAVAGLALLSPLFALAQSPAEPLCGEVSGLVSCSACVTSSGAAINDVSSFPRLNRYGHTVTDNLAYYDLYECRSTGPQNRTSCGLYLPSNLGTPDGSDDSRNYVDSMLFYVCFGGALFLGTLIYFLSLCIGRYCCCCCVPEATSTTGTVGGGCVCCCRSFPTIKNRPEYRATGDTTCCCGCFGYVRDSSAPSGFAYPAWEKWLARGLSWAYVALTVAFILVISLVGNHPFEGHLVSFTKSPTPAAQLAVDSAAPIGVLLSRYVTGALVALSDTTVQTVNSLLPPAGLAHYVTCTTDNAALVRDSTAPEDAARFLKDVTNGLTAAEARTGFSDWGVTMAAIAAAARNFSSTVATTLRAPITAVSTATRALAAPVSAVAAAGALARSSADTLGPALSSLRVAAQPAASRYSDLAAQLPVLASATATMQADLTAVAQLRDAAAALSSDFTTAYSSLPQLLTAWRGYADGLAAVATGTAAAADLAAGGDVYGLIAAVDAALAALSPEDANSAVDAASALAASVSDAATLDAAATTGDGGLGARRRDPFLAESSAVAAAVAPLSTRSDVFDGDVLGNTTVMEAALECAQEPAQVLARFNATLARVPSSLDAYVSQVTAAVAAVAAVTSLIPVCQARYDDARAGAAALPLAGADTAAAAAVTALAHSVFGTQPSGGGAPAPSGPYDVEVNFVRVHSNVLPYVKTAYQSLSDYLRTPAPAASETAPSYTLSELPAFYSAVNAAISAAGTDATLTAASQAALFAALVHVRDAALAGFASNAQSLSTAAAAMLTGTCSNSASTQCSQDGDCDFRASGGSDGYCANLGVPRCVAATQRPCAATADCGADGGACAATAPFLTYLASTLPVLANAAPAASDAGALAGASNAVAAVVAAALPEQDSGGGIAWARQRSSAARIGTPVDAAGEAYEPDSGTGADPGASAAGAAPTATAADADAEPEASAAIVSDSAASLPAPPIVSLAPPGSAVAAGALAAGTTAALVDSAVGVTAAATVVDASALSTAVAAVGTAVDSIPVSAVVSGFPNAVDVVKSFNVTVLQKFASALTAVNDCLPEFSSALSVQMPPLESRPAAGLETLATELDIASACMEAKQSLWDLRTDFLGHSAYRRLHRMLLALDPYVLEKSGAFQFFADLFDLSFALPSDDTTQFSLLVDTAGNRYKDDKLCVSNKCLQQTIMEMEQKSLDAATHGTIPLRLSRREFVALPFIAPGLACLFLILASFIGCRGGRCGDSASVHLANLSLCTLFFVTVVGAAVVGIVLFPLSLVGSDVCHSYDNLGYRVLSEQLSSTCTSPVFGGRSWSQLPPEERGVCSATLMREPLELDLLSTYQSLARGRCGADNGIDMAWQLATQWAVPLPQRYVDERVGRPTDPTFGVVQGELEELLTEASARVSDGIGNTMNAFATVLSCDHLSAAYSAVREAACCRSMNSAYWMASGWFILVFAALLCGVPGAVLGRKRFASSPWGPMHSAHVALFHEEDGEDDGLEECGPSSLAPQSAAGPHATGSAPAPLAAGDGDGDGFYDNDTGTEADADAEADAPPRSADGGRGEFWGANVLPGVAEADEEEEEGEEEDEEGGRIETGVALAAADTLPGDAGAGEGEDAPAAAAPLEANEDELLPSAAPVGGRSGGRVSPAPAPSGAELELVPLGASAGASTGRVADTGAAASAAAPATPALPISAAATSAAALLAARASPVRVRPASARAPDADGSASGPPALRAARTTSSTADAAAPELVAGAAASPDAADVTTEPVTSADFANFDKIFDEIATAEAAAADMQAAPAPAATLSSSSSSSTSTHGRIDPLAPSISRPSVHSHSLDGSDLTSFEPLSPAPPLGHFDSVPLSVAGSMFPPPSSVQAPPQPQQLRGSFSGYITAPRPPGPIASPAPGPGASPAPVHAHLPAPAPVRAPYAAAAPGSPPLAYRAVHGSVAASPALSARAAVVAPDDLHTSRGAPAPAGGGGAAAAAAPRSGSVYSGHEGGFGHSASSFGLPAPPPLTASLTPPLLSPAPQTPPLKGTSGVAAAALTAAPGAGLQSASGADPNDPFGDLLGDVGAAASAFTLEDGLRSDVAAAEAWQRTHTPDKQAPQ